jgi:hypothetical protein
MTKFPLLIEFLNSFVNVDEGKSLVTEVGFCNRQQTKKGVVPLFLVYNAFYVIMKADCTLVRGCSLTVKLVDSKFGNLHEFPLAGATRQEGGLTSPLFCFVFSC